MSVCQAQLTAKERKCQSVQSQFIVNARIVFPGERIARGSLLLRDGKIAAVDPEAIPPDSVVLEGCNKLLTPGLIDLHTHGIQVFRYHSDSSPEDFRKASLVLCRYGTTCVFPTII